MKDFTGLKFGLVTVTRFLYKDDHKHPVWEFICECGAIGSCVSSSFPLKKHCGSMVHYVPNNLKHGFSKTVEYRRWKQLRTRCFNKNDQDYASYGGRGITVCDEWLDLDTGFLSFREWLYKFEDWRNLTIERLDVNRDYSPENCTMIPNREQVYNRRNTFRFEYLGETYTSKQAIEKFQLQIHPDELARRIRNGKTPEQAMFTPVKVCKDNNPERHKTAGALETAYRKSSKSK